MLSRCISTGARKPPEPSRTRNPQRGFRSRRPEIWYARGVLQSARGALRNRVEPAKGLRARAGILMAPQCSLAPKNPVESNQRTLVHKELICPVFPGLNQVQHTATGL
jgi:hypothetical protein